MATLHTLNLDQIETAAVVSLLFAVKSSSALKKLRFRVNGFDATCTASFEDALVGNSSLDDLEISVNMSYCPADATFSAAVATVVRVNTSLRALKLGRWRFEAPQGIIEALRDNTTLTRLDIRQTKMDTACLKLLCDVLEKSNSSLAFISVRNSSQRLYDIAKNTKRKLRLE